MLSENIAMSEKVAIGMTESNFAIWMTETNRDCCRKQIHYVKWKDLVNHWLCYNKIEELRFY